MERETIKMNIRQEGWVWSRCGYLAVVNGETEVFKGGSWCLPSVDNGGTNPRSPGWYDLRKAVM